VPYVRTIRTASGATAVQIVYSSHRGSQDIEHLGSAHDDVELELLKAVARQRLAAGQGVLDLGLEATGPAGKGAGGGPLPITASRMEFLLDALERACLESAFGVVPVPGLFLACQPSVTTGGFATDGGDLASVAGLYRVPCPSRGVCLPREVACRDVRGAWWLACGEPAGGLAGVC
jgi:hypothetical protein